MAEHAHGDPQLNVDHVVARVLGDFRQSENAFQTAELFLSRSWLDPLDEALILEIVRPGTGDPLAEGAGDMADGVAAQLDELRAMDRVARRWEPTHQLRRPTRYSVV